MASLSRGQVNTTDKLNWFLRVNGVLTDAYEVGYRILDISGGLPGTQIFPAVDGEYHNVVELGVDLGGNFSVGSYYAYDTGTGTGWAVPLAEALGTHKIEWRWKISAAAAYQAGCEEFEVLPESVGSTYDTYISVQDLRDAGVPGDAVTAITDDQLLKDIKLCQQVLDRACRQWFLPRLLDFYFDGTDSDAIHLGVPIISVEYLRINGSSTDLSTGLYKIYQGHDAEGDNRRNPRIKLVNSSTRDIYTTPLYSGRLVFNKGRQNQRLRGLFGYVEDDGNPPAAIQEALLRMVIDKIRNPIIGSSVVSSAPAVPGGVVVEEQTDDHRIKYAASASTPARPGLENLISDPWVREIIKMYRAPIGIATQPDWTVLT